MPKRFTDTEKWERPWFRGLPSNYKLLWVFICDRCDVAGIWHCDFDLVSFMIGAPVDEKTATELFTKQIEIKDGKWIIKEFASFQYGSFRKSSHPFHKMLVKKIDTVSIGYKEGIDTLQVKDKESLKTKDINNTTKWPTPIEVEEYAKSIDFKLDGEYFCSYQDARGWELKKGIRVKDWRAVIRTWKKNDSLNNGKNRKEEVPTWMKPDLTR